MRGVGNNIAVLRREFLVGADSAAKAEHKSQSAQLINRASVIKDS